MVHLPHISLLTGVIILVLVDEVHQEEEVVSQVVLLLDVNIEPVRYAIQIVLPYTTYEAVLRELILHSLQLVSESTEGINDETLDNGQQDDNDEQEEGNIEENSYKLIVCTVWRFNDITNTSAGSNSLVEVEDKAGEHVVALLFRVITLFTLGHIELSEEVKGEHSVNVAHDGKQTNSQDKLLPIVGDGLEDDPEGRDPNSNVDQVSGEEEVVVVSKHGEDKVEQQIQESLKIFI